MTLDRVNPPAFKQVEHIDFLKAEPITLDNGLRVFKIAGGDQDLVRIELVFNNTNWCKYDDSRRYRNTKSG